MVPRDRKVLLLIIIVLASIRALFVYVNSAGTEPGKDEKSYYEIAMNYMGGEGYILPGEEANYHKKTSFYNSFPVFNYVMLKKAGIDYRSWVLLISAVSTILYAASIYYFYKIVNMFFRNTAGCVAAALLYGVYPSVIYYIGTLFLYENIALPILIIVFYKLLRINIYGRLMWHDFVVIPFGVSISCLYRNQMLFIYAVTIFTYAALLWKKRLSGKSIAAGASIMLVTIFSILLSSAPVMIKNNEIFGRYTLGAQSGFELLQGHNPYAMGSAYNKWDSPESDVYKYARKEIPEIDRMDKYRENVERARLAVKWIIDNPFDEMKLAARKIAIYFLPRNYDSLPGGGLFNPLNLFVHVLFLAALALTFLGVRAPRPGMEELFVLAPVIASILLSVIFFVGYRWRYYAEPFMIIYVFLTAQKLIDMKPPRGKAP